VTNSLPDEPIRPGATSDAPVAAPRWLNVAFGAATLIGAWLLFQVQPMVAKRILPWFGGGASVWTTAMLFFQVALLAGYAYAHLLVNRLRPVTLAATHAAMLCVAVTLSLVVGILPADSWKPVGADRPLLHILTILIACVGVPYLCLAATSPLVQVWFARCNPGRSPYPLYALSNVGSLAALVTYPWLVETNLGVAAQGRAWAALFVPWAALLALCGWMARRAAPRESLSAPPPTAADSARPRALQMFFWIALAACPSVLLLAVTAYICQDVASTPLLWIAPLVVYLLSFILAFASAAWRPRDVWLPLMIVTSLAVMYSWHYAREFNFSWQLAINLALLLAACMTCHGELAAMQPAPRRLTSYYLAIAAGGALGGVLVGVVAPLVLGDNYEIQLGIIAVWLLVLAVMITDPASVLYDGRSFSRLIAYLALLLAMMVGAGSYVSNIRTEAVVIDRGFYGTLKVRDLSPGSEQFHRHTLVNGRIIHGAQFLAPQSRRIASQYYALASGVGQILSPHSPRPRRIGVVGLGAGTLAAYAEQGDAFNFYELNPAVLRLAERYFSFLADARERGAKVTCFLGDARLALERQKPKDFDVLALDAFTGDSVPAHLLTVEAFKLYLQHVAAPDGVLAVHISNSHLNLASVVKGVAAKLELEASLVESMPDGSPEGSVALWALVTRPGSAAVMPPDAVSLAKVVPGASVLWTDDFNSIVEVLASPESPQDEPPQDQP
jgi:hypothetical protein